MKKDVLIEKKGIAKVIAKSKISENFAEISDADLQKDLSDLNIEKLIAKSEKGRTIWRKEFKLSYSDNEKTARRKIRKEQLNLSKSLLHSILTKQSISECKKFADALYKFYKAGLTDFSVFTNVSEKENPENLKTIKKAYDKMKLFYNFK
jgi:hypothetical protein